MVKPMKFISTPLIRFYHQTPSLGVYGIGFTMCKPGLSAVPGTFLTSTRSTGDVCTGGEISCSIKHMLQKQLRSHPAAEDADSDGPNLKNLQMSFADHQANP